MMRCTLHLLLASLLVTACGEFDDFDNGRQSSRPAPKIDGGRRIVVNGGEDDPVIPPVAKPDGGVPLPPTSKDSGAPPPTKPDASPAPGSCGNAFETDVFNLVNQERAKSGMSPLACDPLATKVAHDYSQLMCDKSWFNHTGPDGSSPFSRMKKGGITYSSGGENIAAGQETPKEVMQTWMNSSGHRANILGDYTHIGVGYVPCASSGGGGWFGGGGYGHYWTQDFWK
jgi:uncharacterized protein YkwD